jgi:hypothetical protein
VSEIEEILRQVPMDQVAAALGLDPRAAEAATRVVIPALLGGMKANAADPAGAESLANAVAQHDASALGADLDQIDTTDGQRIVDNVFGEQTIAVVAQIAGMTPVPGANYIEKLLPIIAPIVMSYLAKKLVTGGAKSTTAEATRQLTGLTRKTGVAAGAGAVKLGDAMGSMRRGAKAVKADKTDEADKADKATPAGEIDDILGEALSPAEPSPGQPGKPAKATDPVAVANVLGGLLGRGKR